MCAMAAVAAAIAVVPVAARQRRQPRWPRDVHSIDQTYETVYKRSRCSNEATRQVNPGRLPLPHWWNFIVSFLVTRFCRTTLSLRTVKLWQGRFP